MDNEIISLIKSNRSDGITWDQIQKNISRRYAEEYSIAEIRKAFNSPVPELKSESSDEFEELPLTFLNEPSDQNSDLNSMFSNLSPEMVKLRDENDKLKIKLNELSSKLKSEIERRVNLVISEKDKIIESKNKEIDELKNENEYWYSESTKKVKGSNVVNEIERNGYLKQIKEKDIIINRLTRFKKITYCTAALIIIIAGIKIGWYYYFR